MTPVTRRLLVGAVAAGATAALGMGLASAQTDGPSTTQSPPATTQPPSAQPDHRYCPWHHGGNGDSGTTTPAADVGSPPV
ncbi:MAG: hypothetical protein E6G06_16570 [Actinobacteria bacterium]|nr:MAG: hypothetical protein E6G06_16570 [Actinomycetota bacterium]